MLEIAGYTQFHNILRPDMISLDAWLTFLEQDPARSRAAEGGSIVFHDLGFKCKVASKTWLELKATKDYFELMIHFHTLMEYIHQQITRVS